jgi:di/tricarboxylate transporter
VVVLAIHRREELLAEKVGHIPLLPGDVLLLFGPDERIRTQMQGLRGELVEGGVVSRQDPPRAFFAALIFAASVFAAAANLIDGPVAFLGGGTLMLLFRLLPTREIAAHVNIRFLVMVAGMVALGTAMERSGAAAFLAEGFRDRLGLSSPLLFLALTFWMTVLLTQPLNNAAAALLMLPIAVHGALALGVAPRPFVVIVAIAASCSFITPFEPANLLVYGKGHYRFIEFVKVGSVLTALVFGVCMLLVPLLWPFR